ncbi:MAG TPA: hypothetical protein VI756_11585, partial [Blastocatellia bacterium]
MNRIAIALLAALCFSRASPATARNVPKAEVKLVGQVLAYRPADRALQVASHALNREVFLFRS